MLQSDCDQAKWLTSSQIDSTLTPQCPRDHLVLHLTRPVTIMAPAGHAGRHLGGLLWQLRGLRGLERPRGQAAAGAGHLHRRQPRHPAHGGGLGAGARLHGLGQHGDALGGGLQPGDGEQGPVLPGRGAGR